jgi:hypothetical protein
MAKFCTFCGKPLPEDGVCDCAASQAAGPQAAGPQAAPQAGPQAAPAAENIYVQKTKQAVGESVPFLKEYWKSPMDATVRVLQSNNLALSIVMMVVNALLSGLLLIACFNGALSYLQDLFGTHFSSSVPFVSSLIFGILMSVLALALSVLVIFALLKISKINANINYIVMAVGINSVPCSVCLVLALVCALIGWGTGVVIFLALSTIAWAIVGVLVLTRVFGVPLSGLTVTLSSVFFVIMLVVNSWLGSKLVLNASGQIKVEGTKLKEAYEEIEDELDGDSFFDYIVSEIF